jgi:signal transduction histidine kinase/CheY-like chemotaxis protein
LKTAPTPNNEEKRLQSLYDLMILDSEAEKQFDDLVKLASDITGCPVSLISLIDKDRQWFKAKNGLDLDQMPRDISFCGHVVAQESGDLFVVNNALFDDRFFDNPLVTGDSKVRFYAGQPLVTSSGDKIGTLCVIDQEPKELTEIQINFLKTISNQVMALFELRKEVAKEKTDSRNKVAFVSSMSHEIRTPLTAISGYIEILDEEITGDERKKYGSYLEALQSNSKHLLELVGDILDFSKLEVNKTDVVLELLSTKALKNQISGMFKLEADKKKIDFEIETKGLPNYLETDPTLLKQIIINLISNAVKFTEKGFVSVLFSYEEEHKTFKVKVEDSGPGISENDQKRVFTPFAQALEGRTKMPGTGLGLNISKQLAELLGGDLELVKTTVNQGSTFEATIKAQPAKHRIKLVESSEPVKEQILKTARKVLIVDDSSDNRFLLSHFLKDSDITFDEASDGKEALRLNSENTYDFVFLDMQLPDMSGFEVFEEIRKRTGVAPGIIAFTASSTAEEKQRCMDNGFSGFLSKPFSKEDVTSLFDFKAL